MNDSSTFLSSTHSDKPGLWHWLLRSTGLAAWFQRAPAVAHAGQEERILLLLTLPAAARATRPAHPNWLAEAFQACAATVEATGGDLITYRPGTLLVAWPAAGRPHPPVAALYTRLQAGVRQLAGRPTLALSGAAGLSWVALGAGSAARDYDKASLRAVAGVLHESQHLGGELLLTAALYQRLAPAVAEHCTLHVAFEVPGHRYPATLYQLASPARA